MPITDEHLPYMYVAYKRGVFSHDKNLPDGLTPSEFKKFALACVGEKLQGGGEVFTFIARVPGLGEIPVGIVLCEAMPFGAVEPHVFWFPEASARNKLECALKWICDMKAKHALFMWVREPDWKFFNHLGKYGAVRCVGKYRKFHAWDGDAYLFQGVT